MRMGQRGTSLATYDSWRFPYQLVVGQQLAILKRKTKRPKLTNADRALWVALCRLWPDWQNALIII